MSKLTIQSGDFISFIKDGKRRTGFVVEVQSSLIHLVVERKASLLKMLVKTGWLDVSMNLGKEVAPPPVLNCPIYAEESPFDYVMGVNAAIDNSTITLARCML